MSMENLIVKQIASLDSWVSSLDLNQKYILLGKNSIIWLKTSKSIKTCRSNRVTKKRFRRSWPTYFASGHWNLAKAIFNSKNLMQIQPRQISWVPHMLLKWSLSWESWEWATSNQHQNWLIIWWKYCLAKESHSFWLSPLLPLPY